jgi:MFS family permease
VRRDLFAVDSTQEPSRGQRNEWLLVTFTSSTNVADAITRVALPLLVVGLTHSPLAISAVGVAFSLPWLLTALHIGVLVDRHDRRSLMAIAESTRLFVTALVLTLVLLDRASLPVIYAASLVLGIAEVVASLSGSSIVPSAVPRARWQTANARITGTEYLFNSFLGTPLGGVLVAIGFALAFGVTGVLYVVGALLLLMLSGNFSPAPRGHENRPVSEDIREGLRFLWQDPLLRTLAGVVAVIAGSWAAWYALMPAFAVVGPLGLNEQQYGLLLTCLGVGGVLGTLLVGRLNRLIGRRWVMFGGIAGSFALVAAPALLPASPARVWIIGAAALVAGAGGTLWTVNSRVITQSLVPNELLGRFSAANRLVAWGMAPVAAAVAGTLAQLVSFQFAFGAIAALCVLTVRPFLRVVTRDTLAQADASHHSPTSAETP